MVIRRVLLFVSWNLVHHVNPWDLWTVSTSSLNVYKLLKGYVVITFKIAILNRYVNELKLSYMKPGVSNSS